MFNYSAAAPGELQISAHLLITPVSCTLRQNETPPSASNMLPIWKLRPTPKRKAPEIRKEIRGLLGAGGRTQQKSKLVIPFISEG